MGALAFKSMTTVEDTFGFVGDVGFSSTSSVVLSFSFVLSFSLAADSFFVSSSFSALLHLKSYLFYTSRNPGSFTL